MRDEQETTDASATPTGTPARPEHEAGSAALPRPLQEHLARELRSTYHIMEEKPAFLGDPAIPPEFEHQLQRLEAVEKVRHTEKVHNQAVEAVKAALEDIAAAPPPKPFGSRRGTGSDEG